ncbi:MAG: SMC-Scp complex subunit ScpB [Rhodanobacteraceae bacterium]
MQSIQIKPIIEAALLGASHPLSLPQIATLFGIEEQPTHDELARALNELERDCDGRGVELVEVASGFRYQVRQEVHPWIARLWTERQTRYSRALLETLALVAYRQPITRAEIEQIRGVSVATSIMRTIEEREWVRVVGYRDLPGRPALFGTTKAFLDYFNLASLDQLPSLGEIRDVDDIDPQFEFDTSRVESSDHVTDGLSKPAGSEPGDAEAPRHPTAAPSAPQMSAPEPTTDGELSPGTTEPAA